MRNEFAIRHVEIGSQKLRVAVKRGDPFTPPLVVFNGIGANLELLEPVAKALDGVEVILFDAPGVGGSPLPRNHYRFPWLARLTGAMLDALGYRGPVDALGVSWGGALAQQFARTCPHRCRRLILAATSAGALMLPGRWSTVFSLLTPRRYSDHAYLLRVAPKIYGGRIAEHPELMARVAEHVKSASSKGYFHQQLAFCGWTSLRWLPKLRQPTLILAGTRDPIVHVANAKLMHRLIPHSRLHLLDDGHLFLLTSTTAVTRVIERFLRADDPLAAPGYAGAPPCATSASAD